MTAVTFGGLSAKKFTVVSATSISAVTPAGAGGPVSVQVTNPAGTSAATNAATLTYLAKVAAYVATGAGVVPVDVATARPDGKRLFVVNYGPGTVTPVSAATGKARKPIKVVHPDAIAITPNRKTAYVANLGSGTVTPITIATGRAGKTIRVGRHPEAIAVTP